MNDRWRFSDTMKIVPNSEYAYEPVPGIVLTFQQPLGTLINDPDSCHSRPVAATD